MEEFSNLQLHYILSLLENNPLDDVISKMKNKINERVEKEKQSTKTLISKLEKYLGKYLKITYETHDTRYFKLDEIDVSTSTFTDRDDVSLRSKFQVFLFADLNANGKTIESYETPKCVAVITKDTDLSIIQEITYEEYNNAIENVISNGRIQ